MQQIFIFSVALIADLLLGEAPDRFHPVAWLGKLINLELKYKPDKGNRKQCIFGVILVIVTASGIIILIYLLLQSIRDINTIAYIFASAYILKNCFSLKGLWQAVEILKRELARDNIAEARLKAQSLVSRKASDLDRNQLASAAVESCAENLCDSFVAPLFFYAIFGLPGAVFYRIINTFDAMIGYHGRWEYAGKFAARLDDVLNFIPARLSGLLITAASLLCKANSRESWHTMVAQHAVTESPNAGWTMSAMAGALGITLEKKGYYTLGYTKREITLAAITQSQHIFLASAGLWALAIFCWEAAIHAAA